MPLIRTLAWRRLDEPGAEYFELWAEEGGGWRLDGRVVLALGGRPFQASYRVVCDAAWRTRSVHLHARAGVRQVGIELSVDGDGRWWSGERELRTLRGCADVDLGFTPSTNMLPIRRAGPPPGESTKVDVALVTFPDLEIEPVQQAYTHLAERRWRFEDVASGDRFALETDELGLVTSYEGGWERVGEARGDGA